jgi:nitrous oxide reductase accessory protein NosL
MKMKRYLLGLVTVALLISACGNSEKATSAPEPTQVSEFDLDSLTGPERAQRLPNPTLAVVRVEPEQG